jgi:hypothetical protein
LLRRSHKEAPVGNVHALYRLTVGDTAGAVVDARLKPGLMFSPAVLAAFGLDSAAVQAMEARAEQPT